MITEIRNGNNVKRFHAEYRNQEETVGHHSANVCAILLRLYPECSRNLIIAALMHDIPECFTGDVPAPFKRDHPEIRACLEDGETAYINDHDIPDPELTPEEAKLLKVADLVDLVLSSVEDWGRGNSSARLCIRKGAEYLDEMDLSKEVVEQIDTMVQEVKSQWQLSLNPNK